MRFSVFIIWVFFLLITRSANAQQAFTHINTEGGLSSYCTFATLQDKNGFIWIATSDGLNRFDGYNYKIFRNFDKESKEDDNYIVFKLLESKIGELWIATNKGIFIFNSHTESFQQVKNIPDGIIMGMIEDLNGTIWVSVNNRIYICPFKTKKGQQLDNRQNLLFTTLALTKEGLVWVGTESGEIGYWQSKDSVFSFYKIFSETHPETNRRVEKIYDNGNGDLLVGSRQGAKQFTPETMMIKGLPVYNNERKGVLVLDFIKMKQNEIWVATDNGIYIVDNNGILLYHLRKDNTNPYSLSDNTVQAFFKDKEGGLWINTYFGGVNYYAPNNQVFENYFPGSGAHSMKGNIIRNITGDYKGHIWLAMEDGGLNKFIPETRQFVNFSPSGHKRKIASQTIHGLLADDNHLWIGTSRLGIDILDIETEKVIRHISAGSGAFDLKSNIPLDFFQASDNTVWIGTANGIYKFSKDNNRFERPVYFPQNIICYNFLETPDHTIWAATSKGVYFYNPLKNLNGRLKVMEGKKDLLSSNPSILIFQSIDLSLWVSTRNGLFQINLSTNKVKKYTTARGLPANIINSITEDELGNIWITTPKGLARLDKQSKSITVYNEANRIQGGHFVFGSSYKAKDGYIYLGTLNGMIRFNPATIYKDIYAPPVYITNFSVFNIPLSIGKQNDALKKSILFTDTITLSHEQSSFNIDFAALNYRAPNNIEYAYFMEGLDDNWNVIKNNRTIYFTGLPPGNYLFKVRSTNSSGIWQNNEKVLKINILPPFWKTTYAYIVYTLLLAGVLLLVVWQYNKRLITKHKRAIQVYEMQKEKEVYASKTIFFNNVVHELRAPVALLKVPLDMAVTDSKQLPRTQKYLNIMGKNVNRLLELINQLLELQKARAAQFEILPSYFPMRPFLDDFYFVFEPSIKDKKIAFDIQIDDNVTHIYGDREALTKIITNLWDNAIKYAQQQVKIQISYTDHTQKELKIAISNDGNLIPSESRETIFEPFARLPKDKKITGSGIGLAMVKTLATLHEGSICLEVTEKFNIFILKLPVPDYKQNKLF
ncbi:ligand-binding sensor domain-containing protein [Niabella sp. CJ426]|uniref:ligand-binding sensor domain-containing protein n=1 Tax=Niabella sp. CJ426 TaxID=3393740 RepID=UPI003D04115B